MKIKGENLRLFHDGIPFAASTNATFEINANIESVSTKDDADEWERNECTGKNFAASVDCLVVNNDELHAIDLMGMSKTQVRVGSKFLLAFDTPIEGHDGEVIDVKSYSSYMLPEGTCILARDDEGYEPVNVLTSASREFSTTLTENGRFYVAIPYMAGPVDVPATAAVYGNAFTFKDGLDVIMDADNAIYDVEFNIVDGSHNRNKATQLCKGAMWLTKLSLTSANRQYSTYSASFQGDGKLHY